MDKGVNVNIKSDENRTANMLICGFEIAVMPVFTHSFCNSTFASSRQKATSERGFTCRFFFAYNVNCQVG